jgi:hypothetical protein
MDEILRDLFAKRDAAFATYEATARAYRELSTPSEEETARYNEQRAAVEAFDKHIEDRQSDVSRQAKLDEARKSLGFNQPAVVKSEPRTYGEGTSNSYFADLCWSAMPGTPRYQDAVARLAQHGREVVRDSVNDSELRAKVIRKAKEHYRSDESRARAFVNDLESRSLELRAMDTGSSSGGSFVTPEYLVSDYAPYRQFGRVFIDQANRQDLPEYGMTVYLPSVTSPAGIAPQASQNTGINETDPSAQYLSASLNTEAGQVTISQQLLDRAGPGIQFDRIVFDQLQRNYNKVINSAAVAAALANAGTINDTSTTAGAVAVIQDFYSDVAQAQVAMETLDGTTVSPTHMFATGTEWAFLASQLDTNGRPLIVPSAGQPWNAVAAAISGKSEIVREGASGYEVLDIPVFKDNGIPTVAGTPAETQIIVAHMPEVYVWEGTPVPRTLPQTLAGNLSVLLQLYSYWTLLVRYPKAVQTITGARYPAAPTFPRS